MLMKVGLISNTVVVGRLMSSRTKLCEAASISTYAITITVRQTSPELRGDSLLFIARVDHDVVTNISNICTHLCPATKIASGVSSDILAG
jgi:hypothetical protein